MYPTSEPPNIKSETDKAKNGGKKENGNTINVGDLILSTMDRSFRQRINRETADLINTVYQMHLTDIQRAYVHICTYIMDI